MRRALLALPAVLAAWVYADLFLRVDLPAAAGMAHAAFRAVAAPLEWATANPAAAGGLLGGWAALGLAARGKARTAWRTASLAAAASAVGLLLAVAGLMERAAALGLLVGTGAAARGRWAAARAEPGTGARPAVDAEPADGGPPSSPRVLALAGALAAGAAAAWAWQAFQSHPAGYPALEALGDLARQRPGGLRPLTRALLALGLAAGLTRDRRRLAVAVLAAAVAGLGGWAVDPVGPALVAAVGVLWLPRLPAVGPSLPGLLAPAALACLLLLHTYGGRVLACPEDPRVERLADLPDAFRLVPSPDGRFVAASARPARQIRRLLDDPRAVDLPGYPEELVWADDVGRWFATAVGAADAPELPPNPRGNLLIELDPSLTRITSMDWAPVDCWVNTLAWADGEAWVGCEDRPGLRVLRGGRVVRSTDEPALGDVQTIAFDGESLWTVSLWRRPTLTQLDRASLAIVRQAPIGGTHFDLQRHERRLFASAYYGSRVRVVDADTLAAVATLRTGFGARALAVDPAGRWVAASSVYDGRVRLWSLPDLTPVASVPVGGHVRDLAFVGDRLLAGSRCGVVAITP